MDAIATRHDGVAPIVVVPDQLGSFTGNPMCIDSPLGHVATYVMHDVRDWILQHLPVETDRTRWTVAGFSEGGTCAIQFASQHPDVFGSFVDVSGERAPLNGSVKRSIAVGFRGDARAWEHAGPTWVMAHTTYQDEEAYFAVGALDTVYGAVMPVLAAQATAAGMTTHQHRVQGPTHNWRMADMAFAWGFHALEERWGTERCRLASAVPAASFPAGRDSPELAAANCRSSHDGESTALRRSQCGATKGHLPRRGAAPRRRRCLRRDRILRFADFDRSLGSRPAWAICRRRERGQCRLAQRIEHLTTDQKDA